MLSPSASTIWFRFNGFNLSTEVHPRQARMLRCCVMQSIVSSHPVLLLGNADLTSAEYAWAQQFPGPVVCADGGLRHLGRLTAAAIIGDGDSWGPVAPAGSTRIQDQSTTDFEKALARIQAPQIDALGFLGGRWDHSLANLSALMGASHVRLLDQHQSIRACQDHYAGQHAPGEIIGVIPATPCRFDQSTGLKYPLDGLELALGAAVGSSNEATQNQVEITGQGVFWLCSNSPIG